MANNKSLQLLRGSGVSKSEVLLDGQPYWDKINKRLYVGDGSTALSLLSAPTVDWSSLTGKPSWIGNSKPLYTASEVGARSNTWLPKVSVSGEYPYTVRFNTVRLRPNVDWSFTAEAVLVKKLEIFRSGSDTFKHGCIYTIRDKVIIIPIRIPVENSTYSVTCLCASASAFTLKAGELCEMQEQMHALSNTKFLTSVSLS